MIAEADIKQMSVEERLSAMELLWDSLRGSSNQVHSPAWHEEVLKARRKKVESGEARFLTMSELRERLKQ